MKGPVTAVPLQCCENTYLFTDGSNVSVCVGARVYASHGSNAAPCRRCDMKRGPAPAPAGCDPSQPAYFYAVKLFHKMGLLEHAATGSRLRPGRNPPQTCWRRQAVPDEILRPASCLCVARLGRTSRSTGGSWAGRRSPSPTGRRWSRRRCLRAGPPDPVAFTGRARTLSLDLAAVSIPLLFRPCCVAGQGR